MRARVHQVAPRPCAGAEPLGVGGVPEPARHRRHGVVVERVLERQRGPYPADVVSDEPLLEVGVQVLAGPHRRQRAGLVKEGGERALGVGATQRSGAHPLGQRG